MPIRELHDKNADGVRLGQSTTDLVSNYGVSPVSQRAAAAQNSALLASSTTFTATHLAALQEVMNTFTALGLWKGSA